MDNRKKPAGGQKMKYGTMTIVYTAIFIVGAIVLNVLAGVLTDRLGLRADITDNRLYTISDTTVELLETLPEDITVTVLTTEYNYQNIANYRPIREVLKRYEQLAGGKLSVRYVDPYANPDIVARYSEIETPVEADIIVEGSKRFKKITPSDLYDIRTNYSEGTQQQGLQAEQKFSSAIMYCLADELPAAVRTRGHDEDDLTSLNSLLSTANYTLDTVNLGVNELPEDTALLIINNPKTDFTSVEIEALEEYLANSGSLIVFYDPTCPDLPNFELFMEDWGVRPQDLLVCDSQWAYTSPRQIIPALNTTHTMTSEVRSSTGEYVISVDSRAWELIWGDGVERGFRRATAIMTSTATSYGKSTTSGENITSYTKAAGDLSGPFYVGVLAEERDPNTLNSANILFLSSGAALDALIDNDVFLNRTLLINAVNYMNEDADALIVEPRYATSTALSLTAADANLIFWSLVIVVPAAVLSAGIVIWARRRNR